MGATDIFRDKKKEVVKRWIEAVFGGYPLETVGFLRTIQDQFANPVAHMTREAGDVIYDAMIGEDVNPEEVRAALDRFIKFRAVQKFNPGENMAVFYLMKPILREVILPEMRSGNQLDLYLQAESRLDTLALLAFDMFVKARDAIAELRIKEIKSQHAQLAKWARKLESGESGEKG